MPIIKTGPVLISDKQRTRQGALEALRASTLFTGLSDMAVSECIGAFTVVEIAAGSQLFQQGDESTQMYCLVRGLVHIGRVTQDGSDFSVNMIHFGEVFGVESLFASTRRASTATSLSICLIAACPANGIKAMIMRHPLVGLNIAQCLREYQERALKQIQSVLFHRVRERLITLLRELADECGIAEADGTRIGIPLTRVQLASLIGTTRETVSYELSELTRSGHISRRGRKIIIRSSAEQAA